MEIVGLAQEIYHHSYFSHTDIGTGMKIRGNKEFKDWIDVHRNNIHTGYVHHHELPHLVSSKDRQLHPNAVMQSYVHTGAASH